MTDVVRVLDHFGAAQAHLLGLSMGGRIAMRTALLHPRRVASLTLVDTHEGFDAFSPAQRQAFVDSRRAPLEAGKEPADIAEAAAMHHEMAAKMGGAPVTVIDRAGHLSNIENSSDFNAATLRWLKRHAGSGSKPSHWPL